MLSAPRRPRGVTMIELLIVIALTAVVLGIGAPYLGTWMQNARIRSSAESLLGALQQAKSEAARRNTVVRFQLVDNATSTCALSATGSTWIVSRQDPSGACDQGVSDDTAPMILLKPTGEENMSASLAITPNTQTSIAFNGLGRITPVPAGDISIAITNPSGGTCVAQGGKMQCLNIELTPAGLIRLCNPAKPASDPRGC